MALQRVTTSILCVVASCMPCSASGAPVLSRQAQALIAPVHAAFVRVRTEQASPPKNVSERLIRLGELDQAGRAIMQVTDLSSLPPAEWEPASSAVWNEINAQDAADRDALVSLLPQRGWFTISAYGKPASDAAWSVVQHQTDDPSFMAAMLRRMEGPAQHHDVDAYDYALLYDRVAMLAHRPQTYGSQFKCIDHHWTLYTLRNPAQVDERRERLGLVETEEQVKARIATYPPCFFPSHGH